MLLPKVFQLKILLEILTKKYFSAANCLISITDPQTEIPLPGNLPKLAFSTGTALKPNFLSTAKHRCEIFLIKSNQPEIPLQTIEQSIKLTNISTRFNDRKYVLIPEGNWTIVEEFKYLGHVVLVEETDFGFELSVLDYLSETLVYGDSWFAENGSFRYGVDLFPDKFRNQNGKIARVCTVNTYNEDRNNMELRHLRGYFKKHNLTENLILVPTGTWGEIYENRTSTGMLQLLMNDEVDIVIGYMYSEPTRWLYADFSHSTYRLAITMLFPKPSQLAGWYVLQTFRPSVWILYYTTIAMLMIITTVKLRPNIKIGENLYSVSFWIIAVFLQQYYKAIRDFTSKYKLLFATTAFYVIIFNTAFSSRLASLLVVPRYAGEINSLEDFEKSRLDWGNNHDGYIKPLKKLETYKEITKRFKILNKTELNKRVVEGKFVFALDRRMLYHLFTKLDDVKSISQFKLMKSNLFENQCVIILRKNCVFLPAINRFIERIQESGIAKLWEKRVDFKFHKIRRAIEISNVFHQAHEELELIHVMDSFLILIIGHFIGLLVFLLEHFWKKL